MNIHPNNEKQYSKQEIAKARELLAQAEGVPTHWVDSEWKGKMCSQDVAISAICAALRTASQEKPKSITPAQLAKRIAKGERWAVAEPATPASASEVCSCPSGDGSLRWPCLVHPPESASEAAPFGYANTDTAEWLDTTGSARISHRPMGRFTLPLYDRPAPASGEPAYDREIQINLQGCMEALASHSPDCIEVECARAALLRAADNRDAAGVRTVKRDASGEGQQGEWPGSFTVVTESGVHPCGLAVSAEWDKREEYVAELEAKLAEQQRAGVPEGWVLVPRAITLDMEVAFCEVWFSSIRCIDDAEMQDAWAAALAIAPQPQEGSGNG